ncbi:MAG: hypothetical protein II680_01770, partial [Clostridia bacterium]|nr:hypothetical protein [Clostridia bacterium]
MKTCILSMLLAVLLCVSLFVGCSNSGTNADETQPAEQSDTPSAVDAEEAAEEDLTPLEQRARIPDNLPEADFGGRDFTVCTEERKFYEIFSEDLTGETTNDSVYDRNIRIEDRFNAKIVAVDNASPQNDVKTNVTSGTHAYDLVGFVN